MTKDECIARFHHQLWGVLLDVSRTGAKGGERAALEDVAMRKIDQVIGAIYDGCQPAPVNGKPVACRWNDWFPNQVRT
jgi:hypothetical protein